MQIYRIPLSKRQLDSLSDDERVLLLMLGYAANQLTMLQKLLLFATNGTTEVTEDKQARAVQTQMILRLTIGAISEAWETIRQKFLSGLLAKEFVPILDAEGTRALDALKKQFGASNLLTRIRSNYAFHYPTTDDVKQAFASAYADPDMDDDWCLFFSEHKLNGLYLFSDFIFMHGICGLVGETDINAAQRKLMPEVVAALSNIIEFAHAYTSALWLKRFGPNMDADGIVEISDAPQVEHVTLPYFVEVRRE